MTDEGGPERRLGDVASLLHRGLSADEAALRVLVEEHDAERLPPVAQAGDPDALWRAAVGFDVDALGRALDDGFSLGSLEDVLDGWLLPSLHRLGEAWARGDVNVAEEHFASASVHRRLATLFDASPRQVGTPRVLVGLAPRSRHELGVLAFSIALRDAGVDAIFLGGDVPVQAWIDSISRHAPEGVVIAVPAKEDVAAGLRLATALHRAAPGVPLLAGGSYQQLLDGDHVTLLGHQIVPAATRLAGAVRAKF